MTSVPSQPIPSPMQSAMRLGIGLGGFFLVKYVFLMYTMQIPLLGFLFIILTLAVPFVAHRLTRSYRDQYFAGRPFPLVLGWSHITFLYFFASLVVMPLQYYFYEFQLGEQLIHLQGMLEDLQRQSPEAYQLFHQLYGDNPIKALGEALSQVSTWSILLQSFSNSVFFGSLIGLVSAFLLRRH